MSLFPLFDGVRKKLDKISRDFLWASSNDRRIFHLVRWGKVLLDKRKGGLGIRKFENS